jgi:hypothetical protein
MNLLGRVTRLAADFADFFAALPFVLPTFFFVGPWSAVGALFIYLGALISFREYRRRQRARDRAMVIVRQCMCWGGFQGFKYGALRLFSVGASVSLHPFQSVGFHLLGFNLNYFRTGSVRGRHPDGSSTTVHVGIPFFNWGFMWVAKTATEVENESGYERIQWATKESR